MSMDPATRCVGCKVFLHVSTGNLAGCDTSPLNSEQHSWPGHRAFHGLPEPLDIIVGGAQSLCPRPGLSSLSG